MLVDTNPLELVLKNNRGRIPIKIFESPAEDNADPTPVDPDELDLTIQTLTDTVILNDSFTDPPPGGTRIKRTGTGQYYFLWGDPNAAVNTPDQAETDQVGKTLFVWNVVGPGGTEQETRVQTVEVVSAAVMDLIRTFRLHVDKAIKDVDSDPESFCPLGYTDAWLLEYLRGGVTYVNAYQPYPTWCMLENIPTCYLQPFLDAGIIVAVNAQTLFAIDTDIENWSDQGNAFVINHTPKLAAFSAALSQRLDKIVPMMKQHFVDSGSVLTQAGANFRLQTLVNMAPSGALFRNFISR
jgi:hypothetical protein